MNSYSLAWFKVFLETIPAAQTEREIEFLARILPLPRYPRILDLCCGEGRHARLLAAGGYEVVGLDCDERAIEKARQDGNDVQFIIDDMRNLCAVPGNFDAVLCLWQSFGHFDDATNSQVVKQVADKLASGGKFVLDIYHRGFFETHQGTRVVERNHRTIIERKWMQGNRMTVQLDYGDGSIGDEFEWQLYSPEEIRQLANVCGFDTLVQCSDYDQAKPATQEKPRMQLVFTKR